MKVAVIFVLLFATVLCRPARKVSVSSSESSEEVVRRPAAQPMRKQALVAPQARKAPVQVMQKIVAAATTSSDESTDSSDEDQMAAVEAPVEVKSDSLATASTDTVSVNSEDSDDDDDDDDTEESETEEEEEEEEDESSDSSESGESSTAVPATLTPVIVTEEPVPETTEAPIAPTVVTDGEARGDSLGGYPSDYKTIIYVEDKSYHKVPAPYKSYEFVNTGKKMAYDMTDGNEVEKSLQVYKAIHVHSDILEEDTSTPEVESQGLDASSGTSQDQDITDRQASIPEEASASDATTSDATTSDATTSESESESSSTPEEEEEEESASTTSDSTSTSEESEDEESQSSEEATATPGAADSDSDESESSESDSDEEGAGPDITTDVPVVITAK